MPDGTKSAVTASASEVGESVSMETGPSSERAAAQQRELAELKAQLNSLRSAAHRTPLTQSHSTSVSTNSIRNEIEDQIRRQPFKALAVAAVVGFVYGVAR